MAQRIRHRRGNDQVLQQNYSLLQVLSRVQAQYISHPNPPKLFDELLRGLLSLTESEDGFIGEVLQRSDGTPYLRVQATVNIPQDEMNLDTLIGTMVKVEQPIVFDHSPLSGSPRGCPVTKTFLSLPIHCRGELVGVIGIANRPKGYDSAIVTYVEPLIVACGSLIGSLRSDHYQKQAEEALRESEERFRIMADTAPVMIWMSDNHKLCTYFNKVWLEFTGRSLEQELGNGWAEGVHPDDYQRCLETYETAFDACRVFKMEYRLRRFDGQYCWVLDSGIPRYHPDGSFLGYIGSAIDITDRKRTEEALRRSEATLRENQNYLQFLAGKLLTAQEEERRLLARELHDDVSQRLAAVAIDVGIFERQMKSLPEPVRKQIWEIEAQLVELSTEIHNLSRQLHPSIIDDLGLVDAIQSECNRFSVRERILVEFAVKHAPEAIPKDVALCLYRITQESLRNIAKHAQTEKAHVSLSGDKNSIFLSIQDSGVGFDPVNVRRNGGLGFASMKERAQLIQGELSIQSHPGQGTVIEVRAPLARRHV